MHRFYCPHTDFSPQKIQIKNPGEIHHLKNVLRMAPGDTLAIFNDTAEEVQAVITSVSDTAIEVSVIARQKNNNDIKTRIVLACAVPKKVKFEYILEKCTELGVDELIPLRTQRTEVIWNQERQRHKNVRMENVVLNAAKQSQRKTIPVVQAQRLFKDVIAEPREHALKIIPCLIADRPPIKDIAQRLKDTREVIIVIGPEGDFTQDETAAAIKAGFLPVSLGETVLKVDTAAIAAVGFVRMMLS